MFHLRILLLFALVVSINCARGRGGGRKKQDKRVTPYRRTDRRDGGSSSFRPVADNASERDLSQRDGGALEGARRRTVDRDFPLIDAESNRRLLPDSNPLRQSFISTISLDQADPQQPGPSHSRGGGGGGNAGE